MHSPGCATFSANYVGTQLLAQDIKFVGLRHRRWQQPDRRQHGSRIRVELAGRRRQPFVYPAIDAAVQAQTVQAVIVS